MMLVLLTALTLRILSNPVANACQKHLGERISSLSVNFYVTLLMSAACVIPACSVNWAVYDLKFWMYVFLAGLFCSLGTICLIKALKLGELSILGPLNSYKAVVGLISAFVLLGELPSLCGVAGIFLIVGGSLILISPQKSGKRDKSFWISIFLRVLALVFTGCEASILKKIILLSSPEISFILWCFSGALFGVLFIFLCGGSFDAPQKEDWKLYFLAAVCLGVMQFSTNIVFKNMEVGSALALFQLSSIVNLFLGFKIFHEGRMIRKLAGTIVMIIGSVMILVLG